MTQNRVAAPQERKRKKLNERGGSEKQNTHYIKKERKNTHDVQLVHVGVTIFAVRKQQFLNMPR